MTTRTGKKTLQSFHARNTLWDAYAAWAEDMDCSIDYLVNEAMRMYAADKGFLDAAAGGTGVHPPAPPAAPSETASTIAEGPGVVAPAPPRMPRKRESSSSVSIPRPPSAGAGAPVPPRPPRPSTVPPKPVVRRRETGTGALAPPPARRETGSGSIAGPPRRRETGSSAVAPPAPRRPAVPTPPRAAGPTPAPNFDRGAVSRPVLTLIYQGQKVTVNQDQFILGRGSKSANFAVKDPNISRKHAAIIFHNGAYYMKDLGSTNGIEFGGQPVDSKRIDEGDVFSICGHNFHFTYTA